MRTIQFQGDGTNYGIPWTAVANVEKRPRLQPIRPQGNTLQQDK